MAAARAGRGSPGQKSARPDPVCRCASGTKVSRAAECVAELARSFASQISRANPRCSRRAPLVAGVAQRRSAGASVARGKSTDGRSSDWNGHVTFAGRAESAAAAAARRTARLPAVGTGRSASLPAPAKPRIDAGRGFLRRRPIKDSSCQWKPLGRRDTDRCQQLAASVWRGSIAGLFFPARNISDNLRVEQHRCCCLSPSAAAENPLFRGQIKYLSTV